MYEAVSPSVPEITLPTSPIAVASAADTQYALPLAVMLNSVASHVEADVRIAAYVLDDGVAAEDKCKVAASLPANVQLKWRQPASPLTGLPTWGRMSLTTYRKLTMADWLPKELDRVIWLDCDLLVVEDISRLWRAELGTKIALAVQDQRVPLVSSRFGVTAWREIGAPADSKYFNAGVLVIDLARWREEDVCRRSLDYLGAHGERVYFWDQEALNAVLIDRWGELDARWNWHPMVDRLTGHATSQDHWIVHFSGNLKPWTWAGNGPCRTLYRSYQDRTAWAGQRPARRWHDGILMWYETSRLRRLFYPAEQLATMAVRAATRKSG